MAEINKDDVLMNIKAKDQTKEATNSAEQNINRLGKAAQKVGKEISKSFSNIKTAVFGGSLMELGQKIIGVTKTSADYIETLNVLDVAFNDNTTSIRKFANNIAETLNLDDASILKMASSFKILGNSMGYTEEMGEKFSRLMTQLNLDTASLFNMKLSDTQSMLQSAVQGQTKTLRMRTGVSVLDRDVQTTLDVLGIDAYVQDMNSAEKSLARVITMTYRLRDSQGDLARTINAPANQFRVLGEQISLLARNIGNVFLKALAEILPYINAVVIVLNKLISSLATLVGFREDAWDTYTKKTDTLSEAFEDLGGSVGGVGTAAKKTKKELSGLREFDKLNVIKTPNDTSSSGGAGGGAGGINQNLLDAFNKMFDLYDTKLAGVKTRATEIAEAIMKALQSAWDELDFTNLIASGQRLWKAFKPFAENVGKGLLWTLNNVLKPLAKWTISDLLPKFLDILASVITDLNNIINASKPAFKFLWENVLSPLAKFTGGVIVTWLKNIANSPFWRIALIGGGTVLTLATNFGKLIEITKTSKLLSFFTNLLTPTKKLFDVFRTTLGSKSFVNDFSIGIDAWRTKLGILNNEFGNDKINRVKQFSTAFTGLVTASLGYATVSTAFSDIAENGANLTNVLGGLTGAFATFMGAFQVGAAFGPVGAAIGAITGVILTLKAAIDGYEDGHEKRMKSLDEEANKMEELNKSLKDQNTAVKENIDNGLEQTKYYENLIYELERITDENGKVKQGYEDRAKSIIDNLNKEYGTNIQVTDGKIKNYKKEVEEIKKIIKAKQAEMILEANREYYVKLMSQEADLYNKMTTAEDAYNRVHNTRVSLDKKIKELKKKQNDLSKKGIELTEDEKEMLGQYILKQDELLEEELKLKNTRDDAQKAYKYNQEEKMRLSNLETAIETGNYEEIDQAVRNYTNLIETSNGKVAEAQQVSLQRLKRNLDERKQAYEKNGDDISRKSYETAQKDYDNFIDSLINQTSAVKGDVGNDLIDAWAKLGKLNEQEFLKQLEKLPADVQEKVVNKMENKGYLISDNLQKGINKINPKIKFSADLTTVKNNITNLFTNLKNTNFGSFGNIFKNINIPQLAGGGMPSVGQLFMANEKGPELVGQIGGQSFVANQNQMLKLLDKKLSSTQNNGVYNIYLDENHKLGSYTLDQLQAMAKSNGKPITIG